jgi:hypothetical protein
MPLVGGGGAGNTAGSNPSGTGTSLNYIGNHCHAESGTIAAVASEQTVLNFTTGPEYIVATLTMAAPIRMDVPGDGRGRNYQLDYNGQTVGLYMVEAISEDMPSNTEVRILIPPFTSVVLTCYDTSTSATHLGTANITGRVYYA